MVQITGRISRNYPVCVDICPPIISVKKKQSQRKKAAREFQLFILIIYIEEKQTRFVESSNSDIKKLVANAVPESTKRSTRCAVNAFEGEESY